MENSRIVAVVLDANPAIRWQALPDSIGNAPNLE